MGGPGCKSCPRNDSCGFTRYLPDRPARIKRRADSKTYEYGQATSYPASLSLAFLAFNRSSQSYSRD